jgi:hypothetical protein
MKTMLLLLLLLLLLLRRGEMKVKKVQDTASVLLTPACCQAGLTRIRQRVAHPVTPPGCNLLSVQEVIELLLITHSPVLCRPLSRRLCMKAAPLMVHNHVPR